MKKQKILVASDFADDLKFASSVGRALGVPVLGPLSTENAVAQARSNRGAWIIVNVSDNERLQKFKDAVLPESDSSLSPIDPQRIHLIGSVNMDRIQELCEKSLFGHFILPGENDPEEAGRHYGKTLSRLQSYQAASGDIPKLPDLSFELLRSSDRGKVLEELASYLTENLGIGPRVSSVMLNAVDELLMNAIFDAPKDSSGQQKLKNTPRNTDFPLEKEHQVSLSLHKDEDYLFFTSTDYFGTLDRSKLFENLFKNFRKKDYRIDASIENAGLGLATTFQSGGSFLFQSQPAVKTQVSVVYRNTNSYKELTAQSRYISIHLG